MPVLRAGGDAAGGDTPHGIHRGCLRGRREEMKKKMLSNDGKVIVTKAEESELFVNKDIISSGFLSTLFFSWKLRRC